MDPFIWLYSVVVIVILLAGIAVIFIASHKHDKLDKRYKARPMRRSIGLLRHPVTKDPMFLLEWHTDAIAKLTEDVKYLSADRRWLIHTWPQVVWTQEQYTVEMISEAEWETWAEMEVLPILSDEPINIRKSKR